MMVELFVLMVSVLLAVMVWRARGAKRRVDVAIVLLLAVAVALYAWYLRTTYLLPALFGFAALHLLREPMSRVRTLGEQVGHQLQARADTAVRSVPGAQSSSPLIGPLDHPVMAVVATVLVLAIGLRAMAGALYPSGRSDFFGLGINYEAPVAEAEFVARHALRRDLYNVFDAGGYLLWRLHPTHRVMTDSRAFPYRDWFDEQVSFTDGERFEAFTAKYRADLAVIDLEKAPVWRSFARSREWRAVFYGPTAAVFVRREHAPTAGLVLAAAQEIASLRNPRTAERVFAFATYVGDYPSAWRVLAQLEGPLARPFGRGLAFERLEAMRAYREAIEAVQAQRFEQALPALARALEGRVASDRERALLQLLQAINTPGRSADAVAKLRTSIDRIVSPQTGDASGR